MHSDSVKNMSAYADQNHAPSLAAARLELIFPVASFTGAIVDAFCKRKKRSFVKNM